MARLISKVRKNTQFFSYFSLVGISLMFVCDVTMGMFQLYFFEYKLRRKVAIMASFATFSGMLQILQANL